MSYTKILGLFLCLPFISFAQQELNLHTLNLWQSNRLNPSYMPENGLTIGLPSVYNGLAISNIALSDILQENDAGETIISLANAINKLEDSNTIRNNFNLETLSFDFRLKNDMHLSLHHAMRFNAFLDYPKSLTELLWQGNAAYIGENVEFAPAFDVIGYHEFGLGLATTIGDNISVGAKLKLLNGIGHAGTTGDNRSLSLHTDEDIYQLTVDGDYRVNSSFFLEYDGFDELNFNFPFGSTNALDWVSKNVGIALDLGATYQFEKGNIGVSLLDIGSLRWRTKVSNYTIDGTYEYDGLDVVRDYLEGELSFESATDTLRAIFEVEEREEAYTTALPARLYASARYEVLPKTNLSFIFLGENYQDKFRSSIGLNAQYQAIDWLSVGAAYSVFDGGNAAFGLNANAQLGAVQVFAITNNIGGIFNSRANQFVDFRVGLNLLLQRNELGKK